MSLMSLKPSCEVCGFYIQIHSHHIRPKEYGGDDGAANRISLCPNCHAIAHVILRRSLVLSDLTGNSRGPDVYDLFKRDILIGSILRYNSESPLALLKRAWRIFWYKPLVRIRCRTFQQIISISRKSSL